jgi:hypothetical protein
MLKGTRGSVHFTIYRSDPKQTEFINFYMAFSGKLFPQNRWVKLAAMIPWGVVEECDKKTLDATQMGAPAKSARIAFGALFIGAPRPLR